LINLQRVAKEIKSVGLYDLVLQDVQRDVGKNRVNEEEIQKVMDTNPQILQDYMQTNVEYNLSNIHIKDIALENLKDEDKQKSQRVNKNLAELKELEKYTLDFEQSATLVIIFSIEFFVLFSVQYFIVLLGLKEWQIWIYGLFASTVLIAWAYGKSQSKLYKKNNAIYEKKYQQTQQLLAELEDTKALSKEELWVFESDEHV